MKNIPGRAVIKVDLKETVELLKMSRIFEGLSDEDLKRVAKGCSEQAIPMGTIIIEENDSPKDVLYFIRNGDMTVTMGKVSQDGTSVEEETMITTLGPGDAFGEISLVDRMPHSATVMTISDTALVTLPAHFLENVMEADKNIGCVIYKNIAKLICDRLRTSNFAVKHFAYVHSVSNDCDSQTES